MNEPILSAIAKSVKTQNVRPTYYRLCVYFQGSFGRGISIESETFGLWGAQGHDAEIILLGGLLYGWKPPIRGGNFGWATILNQIEKALQFE